MNANQNDKENGPADTEPAAQDSPQAEGRDKPAKKSSADNGSRRKGSGSNAVPFKNKIDIFPGQALPVYDMSEVKAYAARSTRNTNDSYIAYVCEPHLVPRIKDSLVYTGFDHESLLTLVDKGAVFWPPAQQERYVFVYNGNVGDKLADDSGDGSAALALGWGLEKTLERVIKPMAEILDDMKARDFFHGAIRPSNMYKGADWDSGGQIVLGDALTMPPSFTQSALYETVHRAMAMPIGRGSGAHTDDMYALGVSLAVIMRAHDPMKGLKDYDIIKRKVEIGSYTALTEKDRFKAEALELLRGLLHDNPMERWTADDLRMWVDGRRLSPKQTTRLKKAPRPLVLGAEKYFYLPLLAMNISLNHTDAMDIIENGMLKQWLERAMEDGDTSDRVSAAIEMAAASRAKASQQPDIMMSYISMALDTQGPARYKKYALTAEGYGTALAQAYVLKKGYNTVFEILKTGIMSQWLIEQKKAGHFVATIASKMDNSRKYMSQKKIGYGLERCLYDLCPELHCQSEMLQGYYVYKIEHLMYALEDICQKGNAPTVLIDRHVAAFLSVRDSKTMDSFLFDLSSPEEYRKITAQLKCLARIQALLKLDAFPGIAGQFLTLLGPVYERFHDREYRDRLEKSLKSHAKAGSLIKMVNVLDDPNLKKKDLLGFKLASREYAALSLEAAMLDEAFESPGMFERTTAQKFAAGVSCFVGMLLILFIFFLSLNNESVF